MLNMILLNIVQLSRIEISDIHPPILGPPENDVQRKFYSPLKRRSFDGVTKKILFWANYLDDGGAQWDLLFREIYHKERHLTLR